MSLSLTFRSRQWLPIALRVRSGLRPASLPAPAKLRDAPFWEEPALWRPPWPGSPLEGLSHSSISESPLPSPGLAQHRVPV